jgi:DNA adenine methylase
LIPTPTPEPSRNGASSPEPEPLPASADRPVKRHGGKRYLARRIVELMPPRVKTPNAPAADDPGWVHYVEPFFGGGAVLLAMDPRGISEVANDLDGELTTFWDVLRSRDLFPELARLAQLTPVSEIEYGRASEIDPTLPAVERALRFLIRNRQSRQALEKDFLTPVRGRTRRGMQEQCSSWLSGVGGLPAVHARLQRVLILNRPALDVIRSQDGGPRTLFYCDPPYLQETRTVRDAYGPYEMTAEQHRELLATLAGIKGRFLLSGYHCQLYDDAAARHGWHVEEIPIDNKAGSGASKRTMTEVIWANYPLPRQPAELFSDGETVEAVAVEAVNPDDILVSPNGGIAR